MMVALLFSGYNHAASYGMKQVKAMVSDRTVKASSTCSAVLGQNATEKFDQLRDYQDSFTGMTVLEELSPLY